MLHLSIPLDYDKKVFEEFKCWMPLAPMTRTGGALDFEAVTVWVCSPVDQHLINGGILDNFPNLKILATASTGTNHIDLDACKKRGIKVLSLLDDRAGLETISASAEFTFKLLLDALRLPPAKELRGKTVGFVGAGRIGRMVSRLVSECGAYPCAYDPYNGEYYEENYGKRIYDLADLFRHCDAIVLCCTYNKETHHMVGRDLLRSMKHGAALVNTSRGEVIDEFALAMVLEERPDLRVAVDVLEGETMGTANPQRLKARGAIVTNHVAGETFDSRTKAARIILNLLKKEYR